MIALRRFLPMIGALALLAVAALVTAQQASPDETRYARQRAAMVETIRKYASSERDRLGPRGISKPVLDAMAQTKRHLFIPERYRSLAYADQAVPIAYGQTISQPYVVALMKWGPDVRLVSRPLYRPVAAAPTFSPPPATTSCAARNIVFHAGCRFCLPPRRMRLRWRRALFSCARVWPRSMRA
jgi:hypothetical protein